MVYRCLDPGRDWDAYCDDHPDQPEPEDVEPEFHIYVCPECKAEYGEDDGEYMVALGDDVYCAECIVDGVHPQCDCEVDMDKLTKHMEEARGEAEVDRYLDSLNN